ncbi:MAG TPA: YceI family protein [Saprospiraceae bacterium]|nr:YceI family protein [Saprospiraceae bacterium]HND88560.1 YceI family protein [Saprospiraceae bacterium]HNG89875.1 YceI family protein [Saprospiraceae bacterium]
MKKTLFALALLLAASVTGHAQKYFTRDAKIKFNSDSKVEKVEAVNKTGTCVLDAATGKTEWKVLIKGFNFEKALMQEHFNENYLESGKFPNSTFLGTITNLSDVKFAQDGTYKVNVKGKMTMHGVSKDIEVPGTIKVSGGNLEISSNIKVACSDYNITIPSVVADKLSNVIDVAISAQLKPMK